MIPTILFLGLPSAAEVEQNGYNLGEINTLFLKKIEELTLYVIEQENKISVLQKQVLQLQK